MKRITLVVVLVLSVALLASCAAAPAASSSAAASASAAPSASAAASVSAAPSASQAATPSIDAIKKAGKLVMLTNAAFPPYEYLGSDNQVAGVDKDIAQAIADKIGVKLEITNMDFDGLVAALAAGKGDIIAAGLTIDDERKKSVDFSDIYADATQLIIVPADNQDIKGPDDLKGKNIGVQLGTTGDLYSSDIENATVKQYKTGIEAGLDLKNGKLDAVVIDKLPAENIVKSNEGLKLIDAPLTDENYAIAVQKNHADLVDLINSVLKDLQASGQIQQWTDKHVEESSVASPSAS